MPAKGPEIDDPVVAAAIARITENKPEFERLDLQFMMMGDDVMTAVCNAMAKNTTVKQIFLSNNGLGPNAAKAIAGMLAKNKTIEELSMGLNKVGDTGINEFTKPLAANMTIKLVTFGRNGITEDAKTGLQNVISSRKGDAPLQLIFQH